MIRVSTRQRYLRNPNWDFPMRLATTCPRVAANGQCTSLPLCLKSCRSDEVSMLVCRSGGREVEYHSRTGFIFTDLDLLKSTWPIMTTLRRLSCGGGYDYYRRRWWPPDNIMSSKGHLYLKATFTKGHLFKCNINHITHKLLTYMEILGFLYIYVYFYTWEGSVGLSLTWLIRTYLS